MSRINLVSALDGQEYLAPVRSLKPLPLQRWVKYCTPVYFFFSMFRFHFFFFFLQNRFQPCTMVLQKLFSPSIRCQMPTTFPSLHCGNWALFTSLAQTNDMPFDRCASQDTQQTHIVHMYCMYKTQSFIEKVGGGKAKQSKQLSHYVTEDDGQGDQEGQERSGSQCSTLKSLIGSSCPKNNYCLHQDATAVSTE